MRGRYGICPRARRGRSPRRPGRGGLRGAARRLAGPRPGRPGRPACRSPTSSAIAVAVAGWSPVTMATLIPARRHRRASRTTSSRGGSSRATSPSSRRSCSQSSWRSGEPRRGAEATASTRSPRAGECGSTAAEAPRSSPQSGSTTSGAPFTMYFVGPDDGHAPQPRIEREPSKRHGPPGGPSSVSTPRRRANASRAASIGITMCNPSAVDLGDVPGGASLRSDRQLTDRLASRRDDDQVISLSGP